MMTSETQKMYESRKKGMNQVRKETRQEKVFHCNESSRVLRRESLHDLETGQRLSQQT